MSLQLNAIGRQGINRSKMNIHKNMPRTYRRGFVHITVGMVIALLSVFIDRELLLWLLGIGTLCFVAFDTLRFRSHFLKKLFVCLFGIFMRDYEARRFTGASFLLIASFFALLLFGNTIGAIAITFLAIGDPVARFVREKFGKTKLFYKTLEGALACLAVIILAGSVWVWCGWPINYLVMLAGAVVATFMQTVPLRVDDNLTVPLFSGLVMWLLSFPL